MRPRRSSQSRNAALTWNLKASAMVDHEVAEILAEIKRRVTTAQQQPVAEPARSMENPAALSTRSAVASNGYPSLPVMARAWDRLPPVVSNRTGTKIGRAHA